jgi:hypothetical protein
MALNHPPSSADTIEQQHGARPGDDAWIRAAYVLEVEPWHGRRRSLSDDD